MIGAAALDSRPSNEGAWLPITELMAMVDAYNRVMDLQELVLRVRTPAASPEAAPASFGAQLAAALPSATTATATADRAATTTGTVANTHAGGCACCCSAAAAPVAAAAPMPDTAVSPTATAAPLGLTASVQPRAGARVLAVAQTQVGQAEDPPGSNDGPALEGYRAATVGAVPGAPWCAYFVSWAAAQAGTPIGDGGTGLGSVAQITDWAQRNGRLLPAGSTPDPGDLILFGDRHVGIVGSVAPDGSLTTVEGNYRNAVSRVRRSPSEATGFVRL